ncbi:hypothetical protein CALCODRAFT_479583 [Calocera cornea HHB12733]|uniref:Uncharacterized protein n=1 Tax=Calocera cornea HHB12733 TaxID=1353952 RepID=A0A165JGI8_9BASI|nr:hypothetical protein CALCODRAFT_479583 [Calocera cornea HHB12733]
MEETLADEEDEYNMTGPMSTYEEQTDHEVEEETDHLLPYKVLKGEVARTLHVAMSTGLRGLLYEVSKLLKCHPDALSVAYLLSTAKAKEHPVLLDSPGTFLEMIRVWKAASAREQDKFEIAWNRREAAYKKSLSSALKNGTTRPDPLSKGRPDPVFIHVTPCSNGNSSSQGDSPPRKKAKKSKKSKRAQSPDNVPEKKERSDAEMLLQLKAARQCHQHGKPDFVLPGGQHIDPSDEDWSFWALALTKKVDKVTHENPPDTILHKWTTVYNIGAPGQGIVRSAARPQKQADIAQAAAQNVLQGLIPWGPFPTLWNANGFGNTGQAIPPTVIGQHTPPPPAPITQASSQINVQDLIDDSTVYPRIDAWLAEVDSNAKRNPDNRNFHQYADGFSNAGLYRINELAAIEAAELVEIYKSVEPTPIPARLMRGTAAVIIGYARKDVYGK